MHRIGCLLFLILGIVACAPKTHRSGIITYSISMDENAKKLGMERNIGTKATATFYKKYLRMEHHRSVPNEEFHIKTLKTGLETQYVEVFDKKFAIKLIDESLPDLSELTLTTETKEILGMPCTKATWQMNGKDAYVYLTEAIKPNFCPFILTDAGFALEYELHYPYGSFVYTATDADFKKVNKKAIRPPEGYVEATPKEYQMALFHRDKPSFIGKKLANFDLTDLDGTPFRLQDNNNSYLLLHFWFTQCAPCIKEIPELNRLKWQFRNQNIRFAAITFDDEQTVRDFLVEHPFNFTILPDARSVTSSYKIHTYPTTLLVGKDGIVLDENIGGAHRIFDKLEAMLQKHLK